MAHTPKPTAVALAAKEDLVEALLGTIERTFPADQGDPMRRLEGFLCSLDESTLRSIAYQHGVFEGDREVDPEDERE